MGSSVCGATVSPHEAQGTHTQRGFMANHVLYIHLEKQGQEEVEWKGAADKRDIREAISLTCRAGSIMGPPTYAGRCPNRCCLIKKKKIQENKEAGEWPWVRPHHEARFSHTDLRSPVGSQEEGLVST